MSHLQPFDPVIVHDRPAIFLWYYWAGRHYGRIRFTDTNERAVVNVTDIHKVPDISTEDRDRFDRELVAGLAAERADISETAQKCVAALSEAAE